LTWPVAVNTVLALPRSLWSACDRRPDRRRDGFDIALAVQCWARQKLWWMKKSFISITSRTFWWLF